MYKLCIVVVVCCALFPCSSAAPKTWVEDPGSQSETKGEQKTDGLQEEIDAQENILSKVGEKNNFYLHAIYNLVIFCVKMIERGGKYIRPLLFVAAG